MEKRKALAAAKAERVEQLIQRLGYIGLNSTNEMAAVAGCNGALDRILGKPLQTNANLNVSVLDSISPDEKRTLVEALDALVGDEEGIAGRASPQHQ